MEKVLLVLLSLATAISSKPVMTRLSLQQQKTREQFCANILNFNHFYYGLEDQKNVSGIPADMSIHWKTGNIYFTLISDEMKMSLQVLRPSGEFDVIKVAGLGQSTCVDNLNDIVYLATDNGVYKYKDDGSIELYTALGEDVMYIAVNSDGSSMYIATWPQNRVHRITNDGQKQETFTGIPNGHGLTVDTRNNIYFVATKTSYILKSGYSIPIKIKGLPSDKMTGVFVSRSDEVFAMDENSNLYVVDPENSSARHLGTFSVTGVNSFAMDSADNVIIGVKGAILKFNAFEKSPCPEFDKTTKKGKRHSRKRKTKKRTTTTTEPFEEEEEE
ncbi:uncharacterized protein LOC124643000 [Helicoverpa zea]|uniref:uncharacterized protein LOC124643000 n=1 Tax=Helicoverpa zea TaxID=7113 RepID=UPI001F57A70C|nr:uncharacterized protein LOC124643000 [Helicoverpa zea]XP_047037790.1 uncharacterized protein LOC124643000 [Helicoverpa zea]